MSVRRVPKSYRCLTGITATSKSIADAEFEGSLAHGLHILLAFDPDVKEFDVEPVVIPWIDKTGKAHTYTPDCRATHKDPKRVPVLYEAKPRKIFWQECHEMRPKYRAAVHFAASRGERFKIKCD